MTLRTQVGEPPFFSIVICSFNRAHLLPRALQSLLEQTETSWEALIVDDGSTDNTTEIARPYVLQDPRFRYLLHRNRKLPIARNLGIAAAVGRYVTFLDADDWYAPMHLQTRRAYLEQAPAIDLLHGGCEIIGNPYVPDKHNPKNMLDLHDLVVGGTFVMERTKLIEIGGFPLVEYSLDSELFEELQARGAHIVKTDVRTYMYDRTPPDSMVKT